MGECAGRGICDRSSGECDCFDGFTGKGCAYTTCPNDCSGHGTCEYIEELTVGSVAGDYYMSSNSGFQTESASLAYVESLWDYGKTRACVCDPMYTEVDCSRKMCPKGNDVLDTRMDTTDSLSYQVQTIKFENVTMNKTESFALTFKSTLNETYTTTPIAMKTDAGHGTHDIANVRSDSRPATFTAPFGSGVARPLVYITESVKADYNNYECGRRGKCDYDSGLCDCFEGYTGYKCQVQTALI